MKKELIEKYGIDFKNSIGKDGEIDKIPDSSLDFIRLLLYEWRADDIDDLDHGLLTDIDTALADSNIEIQAGSTWVDLLIHQGHVKYEYGQGEGGTIPTLDLREIVVGWRDFLRTPPLDGTNILTSPITLCQLIIIKLRRILK